MLALKINNEREIIKKSKAVLFKKPRLFVESNVIRNTITVNGVSVVTMELPHSATESEEFKMLLKIYSGRLLCDSAIEGLDLLNKHLFKPFSYYQRALLSSLVNQADTLGVSREKICIKIADSFPRDELLRVVRAFKSVTIIAPASGVTNEFKATCFNQLGAIVRIKDEVENSTDGAFINLNNVDEEGRLIIELCGKSCLLYPDPSYFEDCNEYRKLHNFNIKHNLLCAAFSGITWSE